MTDLVEREVQFGDGTRALVSLNAPVVRYPSNPILTAREVNRVWTDPALQVVTVHNAAAAVLDGEILLLFRSHLRSGVSLLGVARSRDGVGGWRIDPEPALRPAAGHDRFAAGVDRAALIENEGGGVEDPRITKIGDAFAVTYSAYHGAMKNRVRVSLAATRDFKTFTRHGPLWDADMRNVVLFPEKIGGRYAALFRPNDTTAGDVGGIFTEIRIGFAADWRGGDWEIREAPVMKTGGGPGAFSDKIGPGAPPLKTDRGWLNIFHGVRTTMDGNPYVLGVALHDLNDPARVRMCPIPILFPCRADCRVGEADYVHVPNVVFTCGALPGEHGAVVIYYGGWDTVMNAGITHVDVLAGLCERYGIPPAARMDR